MHHRVLNREKSFKILISGNLKVTIGVKMISVSLEKCTGCRRCEVACAFFRTGKVNNHLARIKVMNVYEEGIDGPVVCVQCKELYCIKCPSHALTVGLSGEITYSPSRCVLCRTCEESCPIGAVEIFEEHVYVCDLCRGVPECIKACTEGALTFTDERISLDSEIESRSSPSQKRYSYIKKRGSEIRKKWVGNHG